jgi:hypothetical protein
MFYQKVKERVDRTDGASTNVGVQEKDEFYREVMMIINQK